MTERPESETNQHLTFRLDREVFALNIAVVREVLEMTRITRIPRTPEFMRGVINLRGHAVPVADMRMKCGMQPVAQTVNTCIIITEVDLNGEKTIVGVMVDAVCEVLEMPPESIEPPPRMGTAIRSDYIHGMGRHESDFVMILDIHKVFSAEELASFSAAGGAMEEAA
ncbi:MAG: chemotaxis protein CheW [Desulfovibrionaceae bacterium]